MCWVHHEFLKFLSLIFVPRGREFESRLSLRKPKARKPVEFFYNRTWTVDVETLFRSILNQNTYSGRSCLIESSFNWFSWRVFPAKDLLEDAVKMFFPNSGHEQHVPVGWTFDRLQTRKLASKCRLWRNVNPTLFMSTNEFVLAALFYKPFLLHHSNERPSSTSSKKNSCIIASGSLIQDLRACNYREGACFLFVWPRWSLTLPLKTSLCDVKQ